MLHDLYQVLLYAAKSEIDCMTSILHISHNAIFPSPTTSPKNKHKSHIHSERTPEGCFKIRNNATHSCLYQSRLRQEQRGNFSHNVSAPWLQTNKKTSFTIKVV